MTKISTNNISIYHKDIKKDFKVIVCYSTSHKFYIEIPKDLYDVANHEDETTRHKYNIKKIFKTKKYTETNYKLVVCGITEDEVIINAELCIKFLLGKSIVQRDVIIVFYNPKDLCDYNGHHYNQEHPQIGMQFGLTYAVETTSGDKKVYSIYPKGGHMQGCINTNRKEINMHNRSGTIIPDTPENREKLESIYNTFIKLNETLTNILKTPENLLGFIQNNTKLLNN